MHNILSYIYIFWNSKYLCMIYLGCYNLLMNQSLKNSILYVVTFILIFYMYTFFKNNREINNPIKIVAFGDSLTEGFGVPGEDSYPSQLERMLIGNKVKDVKVLNFGVSGDTTLDALNRVQAVIDEKPNIVILTIGANDGLRRQDLKQMKSNMSAIISKLKENNIIVILSFIKSSIFINGKYGEDFENVYVELQEEYNLLSIKNFLAGIYMNQSRVLPDGLHPNKNGYEIIARDNVLPIVMKVITR